MMDPAGFEPATSCVASEVTDIFTTGRLWKSKGIGGELATSRALPREAERAADTCPARLHRPEERDLFTTANCVYRSGNRRHLGRRIILSDSAARALSTELRLLPAGGIRTRVLVVNSEVPDLFTTARQSGMSGNSRDGNDTWCARPISLRRKARSPRHDAPRRGASTVRIQMPVGRDSGAAWSEVSDLFTTDIWFPGEQTTRLFFCRRNPRLHHLEFKNLLCFQLWGSRGAGNRNPSGAWAREGFDQIELWKSVSSSGPREKARASHRTDQTIRRRSTSR